MNCLNSRIFVNVEEKEPHRLLVNTLMTAHYKLKTDKHTYWHDKLILQLKQYCLNKCNHYDTILLCPNRMALLTYAAEDIN